MSGSPLTPLIWLADAARRGSGGDDPYGILAALDAFVADGGRGSLDDALGLSEPEPLEERLERRDAILNEFFRRFSHLPESEQVGAAYLYLSHYWRAKWPSRKSRINGGHEEGSLEHLCWQIFDRRPYMFKQSRRFAKIVGRK
jgi:hypothetical protein